MMRKQPTERESLGEPSPTSEPSKIWSWLRRRAASGACGERVSRRRRNRAGAQLESLEARQVLAVVISEFMASNSTTLADNNGDFSDWIELHNTGPQTVDLQGWHLTDNANNLSKWDFPAVSLLPNQYFMIFASEKDRVDPAQPLHTNFKLGADGEYLALVRPDGVTIEFAYAPQFPEQSPDVSYGVSSNGSERGYMVTPTPGAANSLAVPDSAKAVVISELMYSLPRATILDAEDTSLEFIELTNRGVTPMDVTGWQLTKGVDFTFPARTIPAGATLVVAADMAAFTAAHPGVTNVVGNWTGRLSNGGETVELVDKTGGLVDRVQYANEGDWSIRAPGPLDRGSRGWIWSAGHDAGGKSLELINLNQSNDNGQNWAASGPGGGTPGSVNSVKSANIAPLILDVIHTPALPHSNQPVWVTAQLVDESSSPGTAQVFWRPNATGNFSAAPMFDDGAHADGAAGDGRFGASLPAQPDLTVVEYYVQGADTAGLQRAWPAASTEGQVTNALYQVFDAYEPNQPWVPGSPAQYHVIMTPAERAEFTAIDRFSDAQFNATFIAVTGTGIDVRYNTGVRVRGSGSRTDAIANNRVNLPTDRPWEGQTAINLNQRRPQDQLVGSALFRLAGLPVADVHAVRLFSNGVDEKNGGIYVHAETLDGAFAENHFATDTDGNLYRGRRTDESPIVIEGQPSPGLGAGLVYHGTDPAPYVSYTKNTNSSQADWTDVIELTRVLNTTSDAEFPAAVSAHANVQQWFRAFAMNSLLDNTEYSLFTGDPAGDDYAMYRGLDDTRFLMIPYDQDSLWGNTNASLFKATGVPVLNRLINHPEFLPDYYAQYLDLIDNVLLTDAAKETIDESLRGIASPNQIAAIKTFLTGRAAYVRNQIGSQLTVTSSLPAQGGVPWSTSAAIGVSGAYPEATTRAVRVNGELATLNPQQGSWAYGSDSPQAQSLLSMGSTWRYLDDGSDLGTAWRAADYDDSSWAAGPAQLGYGDGDEVTLIGWGNNPNNRHETTYFRRTFDVADKDQIAELRLRLLYDDGAAVYLNGTEVVRANLADGASATQLANSLRARDTENSIELFTLPASALNLLVNGPNVIAVEIHQFTVDSPDLGFDLALEAITPTAGPSQLIPGMNRLQVQAFADSAGTGDPVSEATYDVWYDDGSEETVSGQLSGDVNWTAAAGPYRVQGNVVVANGATLTIGPGTTVFFEQGAKLTVNGRLVALGSEQAPIWFTRRPGATSWNGLQFVGTQEANLLQHVILEYGITDDGLVGLTNANLTVEDSLFDHTDRRRIRSQDSSLIVRNSTFATLFAPGQQPSTDNRSEHIWGGGIPVGGQWILDGNTFGTLTGHNDAVDFDAPRDAGRFAQILNNRFLGGGDDALDMTGDLYVEGNTIQNFIKDEFNLDPGNSNGISASSGTFWVVRNVFDNVAHASLIKETTFMYFLNNTVTSSLLEPLYFDLPGQTSGPGKGAFVQGNIFPDTGPTFAEVLPTTDLQVSFSYLSVVDEGNVVGIGNLYGDANVAGAAGDFQLLPGSLAEGRGPNGADMGARVPPGVTLAGVPSRTTNANTLTVMVGGPGYSEYRYQLDNGALSDVRPVSTPIQLSGLANGSHQLRVVGKNALGDWQVEPTHSTWEVNQTLTATVLINEVLADNRASFAQGTTYTDVIELYNYGATAVNLSGYGLSDSATALKKFVFPAGTVLPAGNYLTLSADADFAAGGLHTGFGLSRDGDELYLTSPAGVVLDSVVFGPQLTDHSIGRIGVDGHWGLNAPTLGAANQSVPLGDPSQVKINEWFTDGEFRLTSDSLELFNPDDQPVDLGGFALTDEPFAIPQMSPLRPLSFIAAEGFLALIADGHPEDGGNHLDLQLDSTHEHLALVNPQGELIDHVFYYPQTSEHSQGRKPDGSANFAFSDVPTPGATNGGATAETETFLAFAWDTDWQYNASGDNLGQAWRQREYDDSAWLAGPGLLGQEGGALPEPLQTEFEIGDITYYFRKHVTLAEIPENLQSTFSMLVDDGFAVYINGNEVQREGLPGGELFADTEANRTVGQASIEGPYSVPKEFWIVGDNVIAVEVHQVSTGSSDLVFGMELEATATVLNPGSATLEQLVHGLRITEVMYHPTAPERPEFLELQNISNVSLDLAGVRLAGGIDFTFPAGTQLAPNQYVVVTDNLAAFQTTYGAAVNVAGQYVGKLSNGGEQLVLQLPAPVETAILRFDYDADWYPTTDGAGAALVIADRAADYRQWDVAAGWQAATPSPGRDSGTSIPGDFNADGLVNASDIDLLCGGIRTGQGDFDLTGDGQVNGADMSFMLQSILGTTVGDANLDRIFNSSDFVRVFVAGEYEDNVAGNSGWADGDWNCDGDFTTSDLVAAFQAGSYVAAAQPTTSVARVDAALEQLSSARDAVAALDESLLDDLVGTQRRRH